MTKPKSFMIQFIFGNRNNFSEVMIFFFSKSLKYKKNNLKKALKFGMMTTISYI